MFFAVHRIQSRLHVGTLLLQYARAPACPPVTLPLCFFLCVFHTCSYFSCISQRHSVFKVSCVMALAASYCFTSLDAPRSCSLPVRALTDDTAAVVLVGQGEYTTQAAAASLAAAHAAFVEWRGGSGPVAPGRSNPSAREVASPGKIRGSRRVRTLCWWEGANSWSSRGLC